MKDLWIAEWDKLVNEGIDEGLTREKAEKRADILANDRAADRLANAADFMRMRERDEGLSD